MKRLILIAVLLCTVTALSAQESYCFVERDTCSLYLDIWRPSEGAPTMLDSLQKPSILFVYGGGFVVGSRKEPFYRPWIRQMQDDGYTVVVIDYRLGMKGVQIKKSLPGLYRAAVDFHNAQQMGVEDVFSAVSFLHDRKDLGIDTDNMVVTGNSAGAIISLACAYDIACGRTEGLPEGFTFKGVMSFAGGLVSLKGAPKFKTAPCPIMLCHGTADKAVTYKHLGTASRGIWGSDWIAKHLKKKGWDCCIWRFEGATHDVARYMYWLWQEQKDFLETNVIRGVHRSLDVQVNDPSLPTWETISLDNIY